MGEEQQVFLQVGNMISLSVSQGQNRSFNYVKNGISDNWLSSYMATELKGETPKL